MLLLTVLVVSVSLAKGQNPCHPNSPCGVNTQCESKDGNTAVCRCLPGWDHEPGRSTIDGCPVRSQDPPRRVTTLNDRLGPSHIGVFRGGPPDNPCVPDPCGTNTECRPAVSRAVCSCLPGHFGDPYTHCQPDPCARKPCGINAECIERGTTFDCRCPRGHSGDPFIRCDDDPCNQVPSPCAHNADCVSRGNQAICTCRPGYEGDPFRSCNLNPCHDNPCGINAECAASGDRAICTCPRGYEGNAYTRCNLNPCLDNPCGPNADCTAQGNTARCSCQDGYVGNPTSLSGCTLEPCSRSPCGRNAECQSRGRSAICSCPRGFVGDPYSNCQANPCHDEPCGANAICENSGSSYTCRCPPGFVGSGYNDCEFNPCADNPCGPNTECTVSGQSAVCRCTRGFVGSPESRSGCRADPCSVSNSCGRNAECRNEAAARSLSGGLRPVCYCLPGHVGDPYTQCQPGDCVSNSECPSHQACQDFRCTDPCISGCGPGAECDVRDHVAICKCPRGYTGDPFRNCRRITRAEICAACGANTDCEVGPDDTPICKCARNFIGNPLTGCRYECERDHECGPQLRCQDFRCVPVCDQDACGENANCVARNNRPQCTCPEDFLGDAYSRCYTECTRHSDCSDDKACVRFKCVDPCYVPKEVCGSGADCNVINHKAICSCPKGRTGDPFVSCRDFTPRDLCSPNPCGINADCQAGFDRSGGDRPVCTCPTGYRGDPLIECRRGECDRDEDCPDNRGCYDFRCDDPCRRDQCGINADCRPKNHAAICTCPLGRVGDPLHSCRETQSSTRVVGVNRRRFRNRK